MCEVGRHRPGQRSSSVSFWAGDDGDIESQSEEDNSPNSLRCSCDLPLFSSPLCLQISCILIPLPGALVSRQPIKTLLSVGASMYCILGALLLFISLIHPLPSSTHSHNNKFSLCFICCSTHLPSAPQLSTSVGPCPLTPHRFLSTLSKPNFPHSLLLLL